MRQSILIEIDLPNDWKRMQLPPALNARLHDLLDRQDREGKLSRQEKREARALVELTETFSLLRLRAKRAAKQKS